MHVADHSGRMMPRRPLRVHRSAVNRQARGTPRGPCPPVGRRRRCLSEFFVPFSIRPGFFSLSPPHDAGSCSSKTYSTLSENAFFTADISQELIVLSDVAGYNASFSLRYSHEREHFRDDSNPGIGISMIETKRTLEHNGRPCSTGTRLGRSTRQGLLAVCAAGRSPPPVDGYGSGQLSSADQERNE
jgi:hypothetical protein